MSQIKQLILLHAQGKGKKTIARTLSMSRNTVKIYLQKLEYLLQEGEVCRHIWFLESGLVRGYLERNGHEVTIWFLEENNFVTLFESPRRQKRSLFAIQAYSTAFILTGCGLW